MATTEQKADEQRATHVNKITLLRGVWCGHSCGFVTVLGLTEKHL